MEGSELDSCEAKLRTTDFGKYFLPLALVLLLAPVTGSAGTYVLPASKDSWLEEGNPLLNFGTATELRNKTALASYRTILQFDVSAIPPSETVVSAYLRLHVTDIDESMQPLLVHRLTDLWDEGSVNWDNTSADYDPTVEATFTTPVVGPVAVDVSPLVQQWVMGMTPNNGLAIIPTSFDIESRITSREWTETSQRPELVVVTTDGSGMQINTGTYTGDGSPLRPIGGLGFRPDVVLIQGDTSQPAVVRTASMVATACKELGTTAGALFGGITSLDADGFTVDGSAQVNTATTEYYWVAFRSAPGEMAVGSYLGDGLSGRDISGLGFQPGYVVVMNEGAEHAVQRFPGQVGDTSRAFDASDETSGLIESFLADGFRVGAAAPVNMNLKVHHYIAWPEKPGVASGGTYTGNGTAGHRIGNPSVQPRYLIVSHRWSGYPSVHRVESMTGDASARVSDGPLETDHIQALLPDGFQLGSHYGVNDNGEPFYYIAFGDTTPTAGVDLALTKTVDDATPSETDPVTFTVRLFNSGPDDATGVEVTDFVPAGLKYAGHTTTQGTYNDAAGLWNVGTVAVADTLILAVDATVDVDTRGWTISNLAAITAIDQSDPDPSDNNASARIVVQATAYRMATGFYTGDGAGTRSVTGLGFQPDVVIVAGNDGVPPTVKTTSIPGTSSKELGYPSPMFVNVITSLDADGFTVSPDGWMNANSNSYYWIAFQTAPGYMVAGSYTGDGSDDRIVGGVGFTPGYVMILPEWAVEACQRFPSQAGDASIAFGYDAEGPDMVQSFLPDGFEVGTDSLVNADGIDYHYIAWRESPGVSQGNVHAGNATSNFDVTGLGFQPEWVVHKRAEGMNSMVHKPTSLTGDLTLSTILGTTFSDGILALLSDGFRLGTDGGVNEIGGNYHWMAFRAPAATAADLQLSLSVDDEAPIEGDTLTYKVAVYNAGPDGADGVGVADVLPAGLTYLLDTPDQGTYDSMTGLWDAGTVLAGDTVTLDLLAAIDFGTVDDIIVNTATIVATSQPDPDTTNDSDSVTVTVGPSEMIVVSGTYTGDGSSTQAITGLGFRPDVVIVNGDLNEHAYIKTSTIPGPGSRPLADNQPITPDKIESLDEDGFTVGSAGQINGNGSVYYWTAFRAARPEMVVGSYTGNGVDDRSIPGIGFEPAYVIVFNEAVENAMQRFAGQTNGMSLEFRSDLPRPDRIQNMEPDGFEVGRHSTTNRDGDHYHYIAWKGVPGRIVSDHYDGDDTDDRQIAGLGFQPGMLIVQRRESGSVGVIRSTPMSGDFSMQLHDIPGDTNRVQALLPDGFEVGSAADVNSDTERYFWTAFRGSRTLDIAVDKIVDTPFAAVGDTVEFTITVTNSGPDDATSLEVRDALPPGLDYVSAAPLVGAYNNTTGVWDVGPLGTGVATELRLRGSVDAAAAGSTIVNTASLWSVDQLDLAASNDTSVASVTVTSADLALTATVDEPYPAEGDTVTLVVNIANNGPDDTGGFVVRDSLPVGLALVSAVASYGAYDTTTAEWTAGVFAAGRTDSLEIRARVEPGTTGSALDYFAGITASALADPDATNDADTVTVLVPTTVALDDTPGSLYPVVAFAAESGLALRIGIDNTWDIGVTLDTTTSVAFTDGVSSFTAELANPTYIPPYADNFVLSFEAGTVPVAFIAGASYPLDLALEGSTDEGPPYSELLSTAGTNELFIDESKMSVVAPIIGDAAVNPGDAGVPLLALRFENHYTDNRTLDSLVVSNDAAGPGSPSQLDALTAGLRLYGDADHSLTVSPGDTLLAASVFAGGQAVFATGAGWTIPGLGVATLLVAAEIDSVRARDGDRADARVLYDADIVFAEPTVFAGEILPLYPLDSYGAAIVDGMVAHQVETYAVTGDTLYSGTADNLAMSFVLPQNGYEADSLTALDIADFSGGFDPADFDRLSLFADDGDGVFDAGLDSPLGNLVFSGDRFEISGLSAPAGPGFVYHVCAEMASAPTNGNTFRPGIPAGGVTVSSDNDGPLDAAVLAATTFTVVRLEKIDVAALPLPGTDPPNPGDEDVTLLLFELRNHTLSTVTLDSLRLANATAGLGDLAALDGEVAGVHLYIDDGNGVVDAWDIAVAYDLAFDAGRLTTGYIGRALEPGTPLTLLVACDVDSFCARDSDDLGIRIESASDVYFDTPHPVSGTFPVEDDAGRELNGMMSFQVSVYPSADSTAITETDDVLVLDIEIPANGYAADTLTALQVENFGSAGVEFIDAVEIWADGGDGEFDAGTGDDAWLNTMVSLGSRRWQRSGLDWPLTPLCPAGTRIYVSCDLKTDYKFSATVQFGVRRNQIEVASGNDGPIDDVIVDPSVGIIPKPDEITVFPYAVGDKRVYPGAKNVLNYGIGLYNGFRNSITLDEIRLFLNGTADHSDIAQVKAFADSDADGLFDPKVDREIATAPSKAMSFELVSLDLKLPSEEISYLFVAYDLSLMVTDSVVIDFHVPTASELSFIPPVDTNLSGEFNDSPGEDVTDGMIDLQIGLRGAPAERAAPGDPRVYAMGLTIPSNGASPDRLSYVTILNAGTAQSAQDIEHLDLWLETGAGIAGFDPQPGGDIALARLEWNGTGWRNTSAIREIIPLGGITVYVTFSAAQTAIDDRTFQAVLPVDGIEVYSGNDGPLNAGLVNPAAQTISTDPLITTITTDRMSYSVGQEIVVSMRARNEDTDTLFALTASDPAPSGTGSATWIDGPVPASVDLPPGADTTLTWRFLAGAAGEVEFCGSAHDGDSTETSLETCSSPVLIQDKPVEVTLSIADVSPIAVNRGQQNVEAIALDVSYSGFTARPVPIEFTGIEIEVQNAAGIPVAPNLVLADIAIVSSTGGNQPFALVDSTTNPLHLVLAEPIPIAPGDSVRFDLNMDIAAGAALDPFRLSIQSAASIAVVDANDGSATPVTTTASFPWPTSAIVVNVPAAGLLVDAPATQSFFVNNGQEQVTAFTFDLLNDGPPQTAAEVLGSVTLAFHDTAGTPVAPGDVIRNLNLSTGGLNLFYTDVIPSAENTLTCDLSGVLLLPPQTARNVEVTVDLKDFPLQNGFYVSLANDAALVARDNNDGRFVVVSPQPPLVFPVESHRQLFQAPASGLTAAHASRVPRDILPSTPAVPLIDLVYTHADSAASSIEVDSLAMAFVDVSGNPFYPGNYFSQLCVIHGTDTLAVMTSLSSSDHVVETTLYPAVTLDPAGVEAFHLYFSSKGVYAPAEFQVRIDQDHIVGWDANTGDRVTAVDGVFPLYSDAARLQLAGDAVACGVDSRIPPNVSGSEKSLPAFDLVVRNENPPGYTHSVLRGLTVELRSWKGAEIDPTTTLAGATLMIGNEILSAATVDAGGVVFAIPDSAVVTGPGMADTLTMAVDFAAAEETTFRFVVSEAAFVDVRDAVTGGAISAATIDNTGYPLATALTHVLGVSQESAFTNYPNPFAAGRQDTRVTFYLDESARVTLKLYTLWGAPVKTLIDGETRQPGLHQDVIWNGLNGDGDVVNNGVYYLVLDVEPSGGSAASIKRKVGVVR